MSEILDFLDKIIKDPVTNKIIVVLFGLIVIFTIINVLRRKLVSRIKENESRYRVRKLTSFVGYIIAVVFVLIVYSSKLGGLTVALGLAGAGIAFALQEVITSIAGWVALLFGNFYKTGDRVQLGGIKGDVIDIGVLRTTLMETGQWVDGDLYNGRIVRIANSFVFKEPVFNYSADFPFLWDEIKIPIQYGSDYKLTQQILLETAEKIVGEFSEKAADKWKNVVSKYLIEDASITPMVSIIANDNWVEFTLRYVVDFKKRRKTKTDLFFKILEDIENTNGKIKFASATFHLVEAPELKINLGNQ